MYICGGFNVYPAEIEQVLARLDGVAESAVIGVADERLGEVGKAFVVLKPGAQLDQESVIAYTREHLANFKAPRSVVFLEVLPRNPGGKVGQTATARDDLMDLMFDDDKRGVPGRGPRLPRRQPSPTSPPSHTTPQRVSSSTGTGTNSSSTPASRSSHGRRSTAGGTPRCCNGSSTRRSTSARAHRTSQRQRHVDARPHAVRPRHQGAAGSRAAEDGQRRGDLGSGMVGTRVRQ